MRPHEPERDVAGLFATRQHAFRFHVLPPSVETKMAGPPGAQAGSG